jgi:nucleotide-binding universal stress UspA family protein
VIRTIAVGFDGSPDAERALCWAADLAGQVGADVVVVHAVGLLEHAGGPAAIEGLEEKVRTLVGQRQIDPAHVSWLPVDGDPCSALLRAATAPVAADLVVVGKRGRGEHSGLLGSTSLELAEHARIPLVIVPSGAGER